MRATEVLGGDGLGEVAALEPAPLAGHLVAEDGGHALADGLLDAAADGRLARQGLHAAPGAAAAARAARLDDDVADLAGVARRAGDDLAPLDHAAADPGADEGRDDVAIAPAGAEAELGVAADADVVLHQDRPVQRARRAPARSG